MAGTVQKRLIRISFTINAACKGATKRRRKRDRKRGRKKEWGRKREKQKVEEFDVIGLERVFARDASWCIRDIALRASDRFAASVNDQLAQVFYYSRNIPHTGSGAGFIGAPVN